MSQKNGSFNNAGPPFFSVGGKDRIYAELINVSHEVKGLTHMIRKD